MPLLHEAETKNTIKRRIAALQPTTERRWGKMTVDQMLWHVNCSLENALGRYDVKDVWLPLPRAVVKFIILKLPIRHRSAKTATEYVAKERYDFEQERLRLLRLIDELTARPLDGPWRNNAFMGKMTGPDWSTLQARHLDHHLSQFGV